MNRFIISYFITIGVALLYLVYLFWPVLNPAESETQGLQYAGETTVSTSDPIGYIILVIVISIAIGTILGLIWNKLKK